MTLSEEAINTTGILIGKEQALETIRRELQVEIKVMFSIYIVKSFRTIRLPSTGEGYISLDQS
jgi:hypothetical protein